LLVGVHSQVLGHWDLGFYTCLAWTGSDVTLSTASIMHLCAIALHRYHGIAHPLRMRSASETRRVAALVVPAWTIAVALSVPLVVQGVFDRSHVLARDTSGLLSCGIFNRTFAVYSSLVSFFIPLAVMIVADFRSVQILRDNIRFPVMAAVRSSAARRPRTLQRIPDRGRTGDDLGDGIMEIPRTVRRIASSDATSTVSVTSPEVMPNDVQRRPEVNSTANSADAGLVALVGGDSGLQGQGQGHDFLSSRSRTVTQVCVTQAVMPNDVQLRPEVDSTANSCSDAGPVSGDSREHPAAASPSQTISTQSSFVYRGRSRSKSMVYLEMLASCGRSMKVNGRERRAEKTLIWVFAAFVALWLPFFCANLAYGACGGDDGLCNVPPRLFAAFTWLGYMSSGVNPCIYTLLNRDFRAAFRHLLMCQPSRLRIASPL